MRMNTKWPPDPDFVLSETAELFDLLCPALEVGADWATRKMEEDDLGIDAATHSHMTRFRAAAYVDTSGRLAGTGFQRIEVGNSGLYFVRDDYEIRVMRPDIAFELGRAVRHVPTPRSGRRHTYYTQPTMFPMLASAALPSPRVRLLALWETDEFWQCAGIDLAMPRSAARRRFLSKCYWTTGVPMNRAVNVPVPAVTRPAMADIALRAVAKHVARDG